MPTIQPQFDIPTDIADRLASGELVRWGGVVRDHGGQIVKHLKERVPEDAPQELAERLSAAVKDQRLVVIGVGVVTLVAAAGGVAYWAKRRKSPHRPAVAVEVPPSFERYSASLTRYLEAARDGNLDADVIDRLVADLDAIEAESENGAIRIEVTPEDARTLVQLVADHTHRLAQANDRDLGELPALSGGDGATIIDLRPYLAAQAAIFREDEAPVPPEHPAGSAM
ncbi:hypothetical protein [Pseudactinotalea sp. Z1732]|uniref:hypothetical protein n=1 Tax=Micrococcales TaxID=85006 RepID=UPI003C7B6E00